MASPDSKSTDDRYATVSESSLLKLSGDLRFAVGDEVLALVGQGLWLHGRITQQWYTDTCFETNTTEAQAFRRHCGGGPGRDG